MFKKLILSLGSITSISISSIIAISCSHEGETQCNDGSFSPSNAKGRGACSHHGGVRTWNYSSSQNK